MSVNTKIRYINFGCVYVFSCHAVLCSAKIMAHMFYLFGLCEKMNYLQFSCRSFQVLEILYLFGNIASEGPIHKAVKYIFFIIGFVTVISITTSVILMNIYSRCL